MSSSILPELEAISRVVDVLTPLSAEERERAFVWIKDYFDHLPDRKPGAKTASSSVSPRASHKTTEPMLVPTTEIIVTPTTESVPTPTDEPVPPETPIPEPNPQPTGDPAVHTAYDEEGGYEFDSFSQFYEAVSPKTGRQKIATAAWWIESENGQQPWKTYDVTKLLKSIGKPLRYISSIIAQERKREDPLVEPTSSFGADNSYGLFSLTQFGIAYVEGQIDV